jgi:hypothetical protein
MTINLSNWTALPLATLLLVAPVAADGLRIPPVKDAVVAKECGACHMVYPAGLLPARSWSAMTAKLADHFGDNAELDAATAKRITDYLTANAAETADHHVLRRLNANAVPARITICRAGNASTRSATESPPPSSFAPAPSSKAIARPATRRPSAASSRMNTERSHLGNVMLMAARVAIGVLAGRSASCDESRGMTTS